MDEKTTTPSSISLTLAYLRARPESAARILEQHAISDVALYFQQIPNEIGANVLGIMLPLHASRIIESLDREVACALLSQLKPPKIATLLRRLSAASQKSLLSNLPADIRRTCKTLLVYDEEHIGAWMNPTLLTVSSDARADESINALRAQSDLPENERAFVIDRNGSLIGSISLCDLLAARPEQTIASLLKPNLASLPSRTSIRSAEQSLLWEGCDLLPVLDSKKHLVGSLRHADLRRANAYLAGSVSSRPEAHLAPPLFEDYIHTLWTLATSAIGEYARKPET